jgi:hypothetical protein
VQIALLTFCAVVFVTVLSSQGERGAWVATAAETWTPYVAVPIAIGFAGRRLSGTRVGLLGALASGLMVVGYYAIRPFHSGGAPISMSDILRYGALGLVTGLVLAVLARAASRSRTGPWVWFLGSCLLVLANHAVNVAYMGWGVQSVTTSSGVVYIGQSLTDSLIAALAVCGFSVAVLAVAIAPGRPSARAGASVAE